MKVRKSNFELMRIISMFMIIIWHIFLYGVDMDMASPKMKIYFDIFRSIFVVHVNSFVLLSGFFQCQSNFKLSKVLQLNNAVIFYKIVIFLIFCFLGIAEVNSITIVRNFAPFDLENYWFIRIYLLLYIFSPFYNEFLNHIDKKQHFNLLLIMFLLFSVLSTLTTQEALYNTVNYGYSFASFTFLYFIGAYLRKYPISETYIGTRFSASAQYLFFIIMFFIFAFFNFSLHLVGIEFMKYKGIFSYIGNKLFISFIQYDNPLVILGSICYFMCFYYMSFSSKIINTLSSTTFGIYLIHENLFMRNNMYDVFKFPTVITGRIVFVQIFSVGIIIFSVGFLIEFLRQRIFKFIYNRKINQRFRDKYKLFFANLGLKINW